MVKKKPLQNMWTLLLQIPLLVQFNMMMTLNILMMISAAIQRRQNKSGNKNKVPIIVVSCLAAAIVIALGVGGLFSIFFYGRRLAIPAVNPVVMK